MIYSHAIVALLSFACGWLASSRDPPPRRLAELRWCPGVLDELAGITTPELARSVSAEISSFTNRETRHANAATGELKKHYKSKAYLQDAFVRIHNFLFAARLLPIVDWGKGRGIEQTNTRAPAWLLNATRIGRGIGYTGYHAGPSVISRLAINAFVLNEAYRVPHGSACLGWDTTEFVDLVPGCDQTKSWSLVYHGGPNVRVDRKKKVIHADIARLHSLSQTAKNNEDIPRFDLIICIEVFEHVGRPFEGAKGLYNLLNQNGLVFFSAPFNSQFHLIPTDFFRYSLDGARSLLESAGLTVDATYKIGDSAISSGFMLGMGAGDFDGKHLAEKLLQPVREPISGQGKESKRWGRLAESLSVGTCVVARRA